MVGPPGALRPPLRSSWLGVSGPASGGAVILFNQALFPPEWVDGRPLPRASVHRRQGSPAGLSPGPSHAWHVRGSTIPGVLCRRSSRLGIGLGRGLATWLPCQGCGAVCVCVQALTRACGLGSQPLPDLRPPQVGITRFTWALPMRGAVRADPPMPPLKLRLSELVRISNTSSLEKNQIFRLIFFAKTKLLVRSPRAEN